MFLYGFDYPSALTRVNVDLPSVVANTTWILDGNTVQTRQGFVGTYSFDYSILSV